MNRKKLRSRIFYGWVVAFSGLFMGVMGLGIRYSYGVLLKPIESEFGLTRGATSSVFAVYMVLCCLLSVGGGWALDRYGPKRTGLLMGFFTGLSLVATSRATASWQLFLTYGVLLALGTGAAFTVINSTATRWFRRKRGFVLGITTSGGGLGAILIAPLTSFLLADFGWRTALLLLGILTWLVISALSLLMIRDPSDIGAAPDGDEVGPASPAFGQQDGRSVEMGLSLGQATRTRQFWSLFLIWVFISASIHLIFVHLVAYVTDMGFTALQAALALSLIGGSNIVGRLLVGRISDVTGSRRPPAMICAFVQAASLVWLMWSKQLWMIYLFAVVFGFLWGGANTIITALVGDVFGMSSIGAIMGVISAGWALGAAVGPAMGGFIFDMTGAYFAAFGVGALGIFLSVPLFVLVVGIQGQRDPSPAAVAEGGGA